MDEQDYRPSDALYAALRGKIMVANDVQETA
jgi:hypothetical protein